MLMGYPQRITVVILQADMQKWMQMSRKRSTSPKIYCEKRRELTDPILFGTEKCRKLTDPTHFAAKMSIERPTKKYFFAKMAMVPADKPFFAPKKCMGTEDTVHFCAEMAAEYQAPPIL